MLPSAVKTRGPSDTASAVVVALDRQGWLRLDEAACLPLRSHFGQCRLCQSVCPAGVIEVSVERVSVREGCTRCGRCAAACPVAAIHLEGFELGTPAGGDQPVELECAKVPEAERAPGAIVVPCLGGISAGRLAQLNERAAGRPVRIVDRGWCARCNAGRGSERPAQRAVETVRLWLSEIGDEETRAPEIVERPLPLERMPADIPEPEKREAAAPMSRRQFFRSLAESPLGLRPTPMGSDGRCAFPAASRRPSPERERLLAALSAAAARAGSALPAELYPRVHNNGACADHRVCTAACPTGALKVTEADGASALAFSAAACIACGACTRACPEGALALEPYGGGPERVTVASHRRQPCANCGEEFSPRAGETLCATCKKSQRFISDAMSKLFGARP